MKHKTAIKKLMGMGVSRDYANLYLDLIKTWTTATNYIAVSIYNVAGEDWVGYLGRLAAEHGRMDHESQWKHFNWEVVE